MKNFVAELRNGICGLSYVILNKFSGSILGSREILKQVQDDGVERPYYLSYKPFRHVTKIFMR